MDGQGNSTAQQATTDGVTPEPAGGPGRAWRAWWRARTAYEEDGTFRPVRLSLSADLAISGVILGLAVGGWLGFFAWLKATQG